MGLFNKTPETPVVDSSKKISAILCDIGYILVVCTVSSICLTAFVTTMIQIMVDEPVGVFSAFDVYIFLVVFTFVLLLGVIVRIEAWLARVKKEEEEKNSCVLDVEPFSANLPPSIGGLLKGGGAYLFVIDVNVALTVPIRSIGCAKLKRHTIVLSLKGAEQTSINYQDNAIASQVYAHISRTLGGGRPTAVCK